MAGKGASLNSLWVGYQSLYKKHIWSDTDQSLKTIIQDWFFEAPSAYFGILKRWTGSAWVKAKLYVYQGSWIQKVLKIWNGSGWKTVDTTGV